MADTQRKSNWRWALIVPAAVLLVGAALQGINVFREKPQPRGAHLAKHVPTSIQGWRSRDLPLGESEFMQGEVSKILNYDEYVYREYSKPGARFAVYVAYWGPGKMPTRLVASHTPDRCWTENGWNCLEMRFKQQRSVDRVPLLPAEWRKFDPPGGGEAVHVYFWHLVAGRLYDYGERFNAIPHPWLWWKDTVQQALHGSREQYFIRITSNAPIDPLWEDPGMVELLRGLKDLGLAAAPPAASSGPAR